MIQGPSALPPFNFTLNLGQFRFSTMFSKRSLYVSTLFLVIALVFGSYINCKIFFTPSNEPNPSESTYEAPLIYGDDPQKVPEQYYVGLRESHSFEKHIARIGTQKHVERRLLNPEIPNELSGTYWGHHVGDELLAVIRADPGVEKVICNRWRSAEQVMERPVPNPE
jgi:hypothetical protein